ncbi:MAG: hypothetical protein U0802_18025 [Candidatus Binatia bacterium]
MLVVLGTAGALVLAEGGARMLRLDQRLLTHWLFFQGADVEVHRRSADARLRYELAPGTSCECSIGGPTYHVTIDEHGARHPTHPLAKGPGVYRILCVGGSTMYGSAVDDEQTIPAALERHLNADAPPGRRYEAWNLGTPAYMLRQAAHLAETRLDTLRPDLVLVQLHNSGRRAYLIPPSYDALDYPWADILADPDLFTEQLAAPPWLRSVSDHWLLGRSALSRAALFFLPGFGPNQHCDWCDRRDQEAARSLTQAAAARGIPVVFVAIPANRTTVAGDPDPGRVPPGPDSVYPGLAADRFIDLFEPGRERAFYQVHPPPATLDELAALTIAALRTLGVLPAT